MTQKRFLGTTLVSGIAVVGLSFMTLEKDSLISIDGADKNAVAIDSLSTGQATYTQEYVDSVNEVLNRKNLEGYQTIAEEKTAVSTADFETPSSDTWRTSMRSAPIHKSEDGKMLKGVASYYHDKFVGRKTANGEIFSQKKYTAACNSLPLGTYLRVTNIKNNKSVVVKVNDRLAKHNKRVVDLSKCSARKIGSIKAGLAKVKVEVITKEEAMEELSTY